MCCVIEDLFVRCWGLLYFYSNLCHLEKPLVDLMGFIYGQKPYIAIICTLMYDKHADHSQYVYLDAFFDALEMIEFDVLERKKR